MAAEMRERWPVNQTESYRIFQQTLPISQCSFLIILAGMHAEPKMERG